MGLTQGLLSKLVPTRRRPICAALRSALFHLVSGAALLAASVLAGWLWSTLGAASTFYVGAAFTALALGGLLLATRRRIA